MFGLIIIRNKEITSFYTKRFWYDRVVRNGKETIFLKKEKINTFGTEEESLSGFDLFSK